MSFALSSLRSYLPSYDTSVRRWHAFYRGHTISFGVSASLGLVALGFYCTRSSGNSFLPWYFGNVCILVGGCLPTLAKKVDEWLMRRVATGRDEWGVTPLLEAVVEEDMERIRWLLQQGAKPNEVGFFHNDPSRPISPLQQAICENKLPLVRELLKGGADPNERVKNIPLLHIAIVKGYSAIAKLLIERGALVDARDSSGWTPLHRAAKEEDLDLVEYLLAKGADPTLSSSRERSFLPVHVAALQGHPAMILRLQEALRARREPLEEKLEEALGSSQNFPKVLIEEVCDFLTPRPETPASLGWFTAFGEFSRKHKEAFEKLLSDIRPLA